MNSALDYLKHSEYIADSYGSWYWRSKIMYCKAIFWVKQYDCMVNIFKNIFSSMFSIHNTIGLSDHEQVCLNI